MSSSVIHPVDHVSPSHGLVGSPSRSPIPASPGPSAYFSCKGCWLADACQHLSVPYGDLKWLQLNTAKRHTPRGAAVYRAGDHCHSIFILRKGVCKSIAVSSNGQEKIVGFHLTGEMFGLLGITSGQQPYDAIAVTDSETCCIRYADLLAVCVRNPHLQLALFKLMSAAINWHTDFLDVLEQLPAETKVISWLLNLSERYARCGYSPDEFPLPMTRRETGNYLGLAHETVTRVLTKLQKAEVVQLSAKTIRLKDRDALLELTQDSQAQLA